MGRLRWTRGRVIAAAGGVVLAGAALTAGGLASAQAPSPSPGPGGHGERHGMWTRIGGADFAARLAQALGIPQDRVEGALRQLMEERHAQAGDRVRGAPGEGRNLGAAAQALGVTEQELQDAVRAARQQLAGSASPRPSGSPQPGQGARARRPRPEPDAFFEAIARQLGRGITAERVREALRPPGRERMRPGGSTGAPPAPGQGQGSGQGRGAGRPDRAQIEQHADAFLQQFADLLGVTVDQLMAALQQIGATRER